jgi:hypothetical protein
MQKFYQRVQEELNAARPGLTLYLAGAGMFSSRSGQQALRPALPRTTRVEQLLLELGVRGPGEAADPSWVLLRPQRLAPILSLESQGVNLEINHSAELDELAAEGTTSAALFYHEPQEARLESFDAKSPFKRTDMWLMSQPVPSGQENRRRFARALAACDAQQMFDGGAMLLLGQEAAYAGLVAAYRRLPAEKFETLPDCPQPLTVRTLTRGEETWFYAVNDSPWSVSVAIPVTLPMGCRLLPLDGRRPTPQVFQDVRGAVVSLQLEPYDLAGGWFTAPRVPFAAPKVELPPNAAAHLNARMNDLGQRYQPLSFPRPLDGLPRNREFEEPPSAEGEIPGWSFSAQAAAIDIREKRGGVQSVRLQRSAGDREAWLRSEALPQPRTGRLTISAWLRVAEVQRQPALRLAAEWQADGRAQYRYAALGQPQFGEKEEPLPSQWKWYIFSVNDLPSEGISQLRVRIDLMSEGEVWIDDVQLYDLVFDGDTELPELRKMITYYMGQLQKGQVGDCLRFLESYWPRFLLAHVPLVHGPAAAAPLPRTASQPKPAPPPKPEEKKPGFFDRLKGYLPGRNWF